jgi:hypothetical protein
VYLDNNFNNVMDDGDTGYQGATVTLVGTTTDGKHVQLTATTDASGYYIFTGLMAGTYSVVLTPPGGYYSPEVANVGTVNGKSDGAANGMLEIDTVQLTLGQAGLDYNFGGTYYSGLPS